MIKLNKNKGITLIALVITIIVLLILAGISIATLTGENGLLSKATTAKEETKKAEIREEIELAIIAIQAEELSKGNNVTLETLAGEQGQLANSKDLKGIKAELDIEEDRIIVDYKGYTYTIDRNLKVDILEKIEKETPKLTYKILTEGEVDFGGKVQVEITAEITKGIVTIEFPSDFSLEEKREDTDLKKVYVYSTTKNGNYEFKASGKNTKKATINIEIKNIKSDLIGYWPLTNNLSNINGTKELELSDGTIPIEFDSENGLYLTGNKYLKTKDSNILSDSFSIMMKVKPTELVGQYPYLIGNRNDSGCWGVALSSLGHYESMLGSSYQSKDIINSNNEKTQLSESNFNTVVITYDNASITASLYINGVLQWTDGCGNTTYNKDLSINFGGSPYFGKTNGYYKDIKIYNRALSTQEVLNY